MRKHPPSVRFVEIYLPQKNIEDKRKLPTNKHEYADSVSERPKIRTLKETAAVSFVESTATTGAFYRAA